MAGARTGNFHMNIIFHYSLEWKTWCKCHD